MRRKPFAAFALLASLAAAKSADAEPLVVLLEKSTTLEMLYVPHGRFTQGSPTTEVGRSADEASREVTITDDFFLGKTPVTVAQFTAFVRATTYRTEAEKGSSGGSGFDGTELVQKKEYTWRSPGFPQTSDDPVTLVTYQDAAAFAGWLTTVAQHEVMLPTEAQWEYAARAGTKTPYSTGTSRADGLSLGWFKENAGRGTRPVAGAKPNAFGLYDMGGNVYEWCRDWYGPYAPGPAVDPEGEQPGADTPRRVLRGGSWHSDAKNGRSAARYRNTPGSRNADNGFRVAARIEVLAGAKRAKGAEATPVPLAPIVASSEPHKSYGLQIALGVLALFGIGAVWAIVRTHRGTGLGSRIRRRIVNDGFWIEGTVPAGTRVLYECYVRGSRVSDGVTLDSGSTFVYTGGIPTNVRIVDVSTGPGTRGRGPGPQRGYAPGHHTTRRDSPMPFRGHPPAY